MAIGDSSVFKLFDPSEDIVENRVTTVSSGIWSSGGTTLEGKSTTAGFFTSSVQSASSGEYYYDVYQEATSSNTSEVQFSVAYGHYAGSGSKDPDTSNGKISKAVYKQFKNLIVSPTNDYFKFGATDAELESSSSYFISVARARMREKMDPGNWEIRLQSGSTHNALCLIDDSGATSDSSVAKGTTYFNVVSGSIRSGTADYKYSTGTTKMYYGRFYPFLGVIMLDSGRLDLGWAGITQKGISIGTGLATNTDGNNASKLYQAFSGSNGYFQARREEDIKSTHYFCRVNHSKYNYSQNPTYYTGSGELTNASFLNDPRTYVTTVGLYNDNSELLAVAKLSKPFLKTPAREAIIKVRLDF
jgi:hypothetical protein